jgi:hypothetical protein
MIITLAQIVPLIPKVRLLGSGDKPRKCECCMKYSPDGQCPYCGRYACEMICWSNQLGCCRVCERIIEAALESVISKDMLPPQLPPFPRLEMDNS